MRTTNHCGGAEKVPTMSQHKYLLQQAYSTFSSERPQVRNWGVNLASCPGRHLTSLRPWRNQVMSEMQLGSLLDWPPVGCFSIAVANRTRLANLSCVILFTRSKHVCWDLSTHRRTVKHSLDYEIQSCSLCIEFLHSEIFSIYSRSPVFGMAFLRCHTSNCS